MDLDPKSTFGQGKRTLKRATVVNSALRRIRKPYATTDQNQSISKARKSFCQEYLWKLINYNFIRDVQIAILTTEVLIDQEISTDSG
jgi:hypothetical protein